MRAVRSAPERARLSLRGLVLIRLQLWADTSGWRSCILYPTLAGLLGACSSCGKILLHTGCDSLGQLAVVAKELRIVVGNLLSFSRSERRALSRLSDVQRPELGDRRV